MTNLEEYLISQLLMTPEEQNKKIEEIVSQILPSERANYPEDDRKAAELFFPQYLAILNKQAEQSSTDFEQPSNNSEQSANKSNFNAANIYNTEGTNVSSQTTLPCRNDLREAEMQYLRDYIEKDMKARVHRASTARITKVFVNSPPLAVILEESGIEKPYKGKLKAPSTLYQDENQVMAEFKNNYNKLREIFSNGNDKTDEDYIGVPSTTATAVGVAVKYSELNGEEVIEEFTMKTLVGFCQLKLFGTISAVSNDRSTEKDKDEAEKYPISCVAKQLEEKKLTGKNKKGLSVVPVSSPSFKGLNQFIKSYYATNRNLDISNVEPLSPKNQTELIEINEIDKLNTRNVRLRPQDDTLKYKKVKSDQKTQSVRSSVIIQGVPSLVMKQEFTNSIFARGKTRLDPLELMNNPDILIDHIAKDITSIISNKDDATSYGYADLIDDMKKFVASQPVQNLDCD